MQVKEKVLWQYVEKRKEMMQRLVFFCAVLCFCFALIGVVLYRYGLALDIVIKLCVISPLSATLIGIIITRVRKPRRYEITDHFIWIFIPLCKRAFFSFSDIERIKLIRHWNGKGTIVFKKKGDWTWIRSKTCLERVEDVDTALELILERIPASVKVNLSIKNYKKARSK